MTSALPADLVSELEASGYFPQAAELCVSRALRSARIRAHLVRPETTFDGAEVRRHLTVLALTDRHLIIAHIDDESADDLNPSQVVATTERVRLSRIGTTGLSQVFTADGPRFDGAESEVTIGVSWDGSRRLEVEKAWCDDPECQADHGFTGTIAPADVALRISALADGSAAVSAAIAFHEALMDAVDDHDG